MAFPAVTSKNVIAGLIRDEIIIITKGAGKYLWIAIFLISLIGVLFHG